ncbi:MAG: hypothetical protein LH479_01550 [Polaromonas sp.]|nr:hypothetical protein [Polaromonas sp.]
MNRITTALNVAAFAATSMVGAAAWAADDTKAGAKTNKADQTQVMPAREDLKPGAAPTIESMDANTQRAHDRDRGAKPEPRASAARAAPSAKAGPALAAGDVRDWKKIDKNQDNLISPEEMESELNEAWQQRKSTAAKN